MRELRGSLVGPTPNSSGARVGGLPRRSCPGPPVVPLEPQEDGEVCETGQRRSPRRKTGVRSRHREERRGRKGS